MSKVTDETLARWTLWAETTQHQVVRLWAHREVWQQVRDLITRNSERIQGDGAFLGAFTRMYVDSQALAVRRLADRDQDAISVVRLLTQMRDQPAMLSRDAYVRRYRATAGDDLAVERANADYDRLVGPGRDALDPERIQADIDRLLADVGTIMKLATRTAAHLDRRGVDEPVTFGELAHVVDDVFDLWEPYYQLLTAKALAWPPTIQGDPLAPFTAALE